MRRYPRPGSGMGGYMDPYLSNVIAFSDEVMIHPDDGVIIVLDPERDYVPLAGALGGEVINFSADPPVHRNALNRVQRCGAEDDPDN